MSINPLQILRDCVAESNGDLAAAILACDYIFSTQVDNQPAQPPQPTFAQGGDTQNGKWRTIGGHPNPETGEEHVGGYKVLINDKGVIIKGRGTGTKVKNIGKYFDRLNERRADGRTTAARVKGRGQGRGANDGTSNQTGRGMEGQTPRSGNGTPGQSGQGTNKSIDTGTPEDQSVEQDITEEEAAQQAIDKVSKRIDRYANLFRKKGNTQVAEWLDMLKEHINEVGVSSALSALGDERTSNQGPVQYRGSDQEISEDADFVKGYLARAGIMLVQNNQIAPNVPLVASAPLPEDLEKQRQAQGQQGDVLPKWGNIDTKLTESKLLPGLESSEDINTVAGKQVTHLTPDVLKALDKKYGKGKWIIKSYGDEAYAGFGIFFPQRAQAIQEDAKATIKDAEKQLKKQGYELTRDETGLVNGLRDTRNKQQYAFGTKEFATITNKKVKQLGKIVSTVATNENGAALPLGTEDALQQNYGIKMRWNEPTEPGGEKKAVGITTIEGKEINFDTPEWEKFKAYDLEDTGGATVNEVERAINWGGEKGKSAYMVSPAFEAVGVSEADRAMGMTWETSTEGRVHVVVRNGKASVIPYATMASRGDVLPAVFADENIKAMEKAAQDAIDALPESERNGQVYAPDVMKTSEGWRVVELNASVESGSSGWLEHNPMVMDAYVSHISGRDPAHVRFIRNLLRDRMKSGDVMPVSARAKPEKSSPQNRSESTQNRGGENAQSPSSNAPQSAPDAANDPSALSFAFDPTKHPRKGKGEDGAGQFTKKPYEDDFPNIPERAKSAIVRTIRHWKDRIEEMAKEEMELDGLDEPPSMLTMMYDIVEEEFGGFPFSAREEIRDFVEREMAKHISLSHESTFAFDPKQHPRKGKGEGGGRFTEKGAYEATEMRDKRRNDLEDEMKGLVRRGLRHAKRVAEEMDIPLEEALFYFIIDETENFQDLFLSKPHYFNFTGSEKGTKKAREEFRQDVMEIIEREIAKYDSPSLAFSWDPKKHPRKRKGVEGAGRFVEKDTGGRVYSIKHGKLQVKYSVHKNKRINGPKIRLTNYKQQDVHSCGFVAALTISKYFDPDTDEHEVLKAVRPSINSGVNRYNLIDSLDTLGIDTEYRKDLTISDLRRYVKKGIPVIVSVWPDEWISDHWTIVQGFDDDNNLVYLTNHKRLPIPLFKKQWSDMDMRSKGNSGEGIVCFPQGYDEDTFDIDDLALSVDAGDTGTRRVGEVWKGPSGHYFTKNRDGHVVPAPNPNKPNRAARRREARAPLQRPQQQTTQQPQTQSQAPQKTKPSEKVMAATLKVKSAIDKLPEGLDDFVEVVIKERGLPPEHAEKVKKVNRVVNAIATAATQAATFNAPGTESPDSWLSDQLVKAVPVGSLAYLAYSTVRNPMAVIRAARRVIGGGQAHAQQTQGAAMSFDPNKHPRKGKGQEGGRFIKKGSGTVVVDWSKMFLYGYVNADSPEKSEKILRSLIGDLEHNPVARTLAYSPVVGIRNLRSGANSSQLLDLEDDDMSGVFKPADGEVTGLRGTIEAGTYYQREIAAYDVAKVLGFDDLVPVTTLRIVDTQIGSIQQFVEGKVAAKFWSVNKGEEYNGDKDLARAAVFDYLIGNLDRNLCNWLISEDEGKLTLIDHGLCFPNSHDPFDWQNMNLIGEAVARRLSIPDLSDWEDKWPEVEETLKRTLSEEAIALTKKRFDTLVSYSLHNDNAKISNLPGTDPKWNTLGSQVRN